MASHIERRKFLAALGGAAAAWPLAARAQQHERMRRVGVLVAEASGLEQFWRLFREDMAELGCVEGQNIRYEFRSDQGQISRASALAAELVRLNVDLIATVRTFRSNELAIKIPKSMICKKPALTVFQTRA
jgi:ABC-type uncharacterized transport system substrate-binding protein